MRLAYPRYPVDRYLVQDSKQFEMVNIIDDDLWKPEPALRPEDEIILRKLHDMLQSTADDLKLLSGELSKFHEPGVQVKSQPTPLDDEFNEKVHIEEIVNAKFHGYKMIDPPRNLPNIKQSTKIEDLKNRKNLQNNELVSKIRIENKPPIDKKASIKKLGFSRTRIMQINNENQTSSRSQKLNNGKIVNNTPAVGYNEFCYTYTEQKVKNNPAEKLKVQDMPSINIRSELKQQKVLQLDIIPESSDIAPQEPLKSNVSVISVSYGVQEKTIEKQNMTKPSTNSVKNDNQELNTNSKVRKVSKMSTCESSGSTNNLSSDSKLKKVTQQRIITSIKNSPKSSRFRSKKPKNEPENRTRLNIDEWKRKLNLVYGASTSKSNKQINKPKLNPQQTTQKPSEYIPYSKLTIGGVKASDIEREILDLPNKNDLPLSPIIDNILSRENSFNRNSPRRKKNSPRILSTSDENLLQEVLDIERSVSLTLSKTVGGNINEPAKQDIASDNGKRTENSDSYADDFEDEKSDHSKQSDSKEQDSLPIHDQINNDNEVDSGSADNNHISESKNIGTTSKKQCNLSFKDSVDIFEYIHSVDTQDTATQSNASNKITPKETQTSPHNDRANIQPIHNDLWPSIDPRREVEKMFEMEKEIIKKLIIEEYGDLLEKNINKPSTSNELANDTKKNTTAVQKNTQTSPARVKSVMTSPKRTKTRTTSPYNSTVNKQTSPIIFLSNNESDEKVLNDISNEAEDISVILSSPRFSLRLPQTSKEVLSNLERDTHRSTKISGKREKNSTFRKTTISSSSSVDADNSSSELSSLGEVKIKRRLKKRIPTDSESSTNSTISKYSVELQTLSIMPHKSEGELSLGQTLKPSRVYGQSDGETSFGQK